jgi:uncharacterized surface protein with fasciclin (FAS1) repeats
MTSRGILGATALVTALSFVAAPAVTAQQTQPGAAGAAGQAAAPSMGTIAHDEGFIAWSEGFEAARLGDQLGERPHTAFVADDAAYGQVPAAQRQAWQTDPAAQRAAIGHTLVEGRITRDDLRQRQYLTTIDGQRLPVRWEGDRVWVGDAEVRPGEIEAGTGMIYRVDRVTWPQQEMQHQQHQHQHQQVQPGQQTQPVMQQPVREPVRKN